LTMRDSTISGNAATGAHPTPTQYVVGWGGGIFNSNTVILTVSNSTISGNFAADGGGGIANLSSATVTVSNSTISDNSTGANPQQGGAGIMIFSFVGSSTVNIKSTILGNSGGNCVLLLNGAVLNASGINLATDSSCGANLTQVTPAQLNLGPLALNSPGATETHALLPGSVAIDAASDCTDFGGIPVTTDQRGVARPQGAACDIGAFEVAEVTNTTPTITAVGVTRRQDAGASDSLIAMVSDAEDAKTALTVTVNGSSSATVNGVSVSNIAIDSGGHVTANVAAACGATGASFTLR